MTLKKLFSHKEHHQSSNSDNCNNGLKAYSRTHDSTKSSSVSLPRSISRLNHRDKDRSYPSKSKSLKYSNEKSYLPSSTIIEQQRETQPNPNIAVEDRPVVPPHSITDSTKMEMSDSNKGQFGSGDINNIVNSLRYSMTADMEKDDKDGSDSFHSLDNMDEKAEIKGEGKADLYAELVAVQNRLENVDATQSLQMKEKLQTINSTLMLALEKGNQLESRTKTVIENSKKLISALSDHNKSLVASQENMSLELERIKKENEAAIAELQGKHETTLTELLEKNETEKRNIHQNLQSQLESEGSAYQDLKTEQERLLAEILALKTSEESLKTELQQVKEAHKDALRNVQIEHEASLSELHNQHNQLSATHEQLKDQYNQHLSALEDLKEKYTQQSTSLAELSNQYRDQIATYQTLQTEHDKHIHDFDQLKAQYDVMMKENNNLSLQLERQTDIHRNLARILQQNLGNDKENINSEVDLQNKLEEIIRKLNSAQATNTQLEIKLQSVQNSHAEELQILQTKHENERKQQIEEFENEKQTIAEDLKIREEKVLNNIRQENKNLSELVECLQAKIKELSVSNRNSVISMTRNNSTRKLNRKEQDRQEELMEMHTRAQFSLIEYLEGEDDVISAMSKFKKQLEAEMKELESTDTRPNSNIGFISSASASQTMR
ncbi:hypothetical protein BDF20DRAFT_902773 [Mycotypha africana]|uniref:uncharacterized protein n=1 Tax=Mycotypha africana TaxID=64632 RepID=UPI0022FFC9B8|nr:uncharacterized protein BDF20DRAFT_902773 [Mycotypha africana]KAI8966988.1 hypothetical protein BDF20DRAFT_902773 [Mycotypha africana]